MNATKEVPGEAEYVVTAALAVIRCAPDGHFEHVYRGGPVPPNADPEQVKHLLSSGLIASIHLQGRPEA